MFTVLTVIVILVMFLYLYHLDPSVVSVIPVVAFGVYIFFFQAEDCIRDLVRSCGLGDVYKRQTYRQSFSIGHLLKLVAQGERTTEIPWFVGGGSTVMVD